MGTDEVRIGGFRVVPGERELLGSPEIRKALEDPENLKCFDEEIWPLISKSYCESAGTTTSPVFLLEHSFLFGDGGPQMCFEPYSYSGSTDLTEKLHSRMIRASRSYQEFLGIRLFSFIGEQNAEALTEPLFGLPMIEESDGLVWEDPKLCPVKRILSEAAEKHPIITEVHFAYSYPPKDGGGLQRSRLNTNMFEEPERFCRYLWPARLKKLRMAAMSDPQNLLVTVPTYACISSYCAAEKHKEAYGIKPLRIRL